MSLTQNNYRLNEKCDERRFVLPATAAHFEDWHTVPGFQQTCLSNTNHTKRFLKTTIRSQSCIPLAWHWRGGEGLAGTPKVPSTSKRIKGRFGLQHYRGSAVFWQAGMQSLLLPYLAKASHHFTEHAMEKGRDRAKILSYEKTMSTKHTFKKWKDICGMRMTRGVPSTALTLIREEPHALG